MDVIGSDEQVRTDDGAYTANVEVNTQDVAEPQTDAAEVSSQTEVETAKAKRKLPSGIQKIVDFLKAHEDIRQMVYFLLFSVLCGATQMIVTYALSAGLKLESHLGSTRIDWFVFHYATQAEFIGFLIGSIVGQVLTFVLNRKKTFNTTDHVAIRAIMYAIMAVLIIIMQTALGGAVTDACWSAKPDANGFLDLVFNLTGQFVAGIAALIVNFLGNKFFIMRDWSGKKKAKATESTEVSDETDSTQSVSELQSNNQSNEVAEATEATEVAE